MNSLNRLACLLALLAAAPLRAETVIKFATLAPEGSTWMKELEGLDQELQARTGGQVKFRFYPGGVSGDEQDMVRKLRIGQLQAAGLTGVGLGEISPEVRILDAPFLFKSYAELDDVTSAIGGELSDSLEKQGYVVLGWTDVGFVYLFTSRPVRSLSDLRGIKMWAWEGDPIAETAFKAAGVSPIPLSVTDVTTSLETGLINGVYGSPLAVLAMQWYAKTHYIHSRPMAHAAGAVLVSKKLLDRLPPDQRKTLLEVSAKHLARLMRLSRLENAKALETLQKEGLQLENPAPGAVAQYDQIGRKARSELVGRLYPQALLDRVEKLLAGFRSEHAQKG